MCRTQLLYGYPHATARLRILGRRLSVLLHEVRLRHRLEDERHGREQVKLLLEGGTEVELEAIAGALGLTLESGSGGRRARLLGSRLDRLVRLDALQVARLRARRPHVLHAHVNALDNLPLAVDLVDLNADRTLADVPHAASTAVVELMRHALLLRGVGNNIDHVANLVFPHEGRQAGVATLCAELLREEIAGTRAVASRTLVSGTHGCRCLR
mmetsp:Transcript_31967/g.83642  ORF Transcript_31967/g.83642 Transcript_31967/m.83642 type:complete len:213 (+) Transcript_31967:270-908(+)